MVPKRWIRLDKTPIRYNISVYTAKCVSVWTEPKGGTKILLYKWINWIKYCHFLHCGKEYGIIYITAMKIRYFFLSHYVNDNDIFFHRCSEEDGLHFKIAVTMLVKKIRKHIFFTAVMKTRLICIGNDRERVFANDGNEIITLNFF